MLRTLRYFHPNLFAYQLSKKNKKMHLMELRPFFLLHAQPPKGLMALQAYALSSGPLSHPKVLLLL
jgi:hypothetical protein